MYSGKFLWVQLIIGNLCFRGEFTEREGRIRKVVGEILANLISITDYSACKLPHSMAGGFFRDQGIEKLIYDD